MDVITVYADSVTQVYICQLTEDLSQNDFLTEVELTEISALQHLQRKKNI